MAGVIRNSFVSVARQIVKPCHSHKILANTSHACKQSGNLGILSRNVTRNLWYLSNDKTSQHAREYGGASCVSSLSRRSKLCGCCGLKQVHTEVDGAISKFLEKEIQLEESSTLNQRLPKLKDFEVTSSNGSEVELTKTQGNEKIVLKLNVNGAVDTEEEDPNVNQSEELDNNNMVCKPSFTVELIKGDQQQKLALNCFFTSKDMMDNDQEDVVEDLYEIQEVALFTGELKENVYTVQAENMDGDLYDLLMDMLDERGLDDEFINSFTQFCTVYEHNKYLSFLKDLKKFAEQN